MELNLKMRERAKAFFKDGKLALVLKLKLPFAECENEAFSSRFNGFYEELYKCYVSECERRLKERCEMARSVSLTVECEEKHAPVGAIFITRSHKLRLKSGESAAFLSLDAFDVATGLLLKTKRNLKTLT